MKVKMYNENATFNRSCRNACDLVCRCVKKGIRFCVKKGIGSCHCYSFVHVKTTSFRLSAS